MHGGKEAIGNLHRATVERVCAPAQARRVDRMLPLLSEQELTYYKRGRNAHVHQIPKNATREQYAKATGLECLFGALYLAGRVERLNELFLQRWRNLMPFDALFLTAVRRELEGSLTGCRVDKVQQPQRDTLILSMRGAAGGGKLLLTASPNHPRIHLTNEPAENPAQPPMFCMLLRKHLTGGRLVGMQQPEMERLLDLTFDCTDEMGSPTQKHLILEIMGRNSNLILTAEDGRILDCLRRVDFEMSEQRQVLPGLYYHLPPTQGKRDPFAVTQEELTALLAAQRSPRRLDGWLLDTFGGFSPLVCRELAFCLTGDLDTDVSELPEAEKTALAARLHARIEQLRTQPPQPVLLEKDGRPWDFTCLPVTQYGDFVRQEAFDSFSRLLDRFYAARDRADAIRQSSQVIRKTVSNLQARTARKLENQRKELAATHDRERLRRLGDILTANLYAVKRGQTKLRAADFYDPEMKEIEIPLNPAISPQQNAAKFYKDYQKAKTAEKVPTEQIARGEQELAYLASVLDALTRAESVRDLQEIRAELVSGGYLRQTDRKKQMKLPPSRPMRFVSSDGFGIWVGRSNRQNDELTTKLAAKTDLWLHVQKIPGSHVIIETGGQTPPDRTVTEAMQLAAYYSQAREGQNVPVDYTPVKYVKKARRGQPGMVISRRTRPPSSRRTRRCARR
ncbi:MAG: NFACT RNA binding domain-containing protein [Oscillospiraceae bacterium]